MIGPSRTPSPVWWMVPIVLALALVFLAAAMSKTPMSPEAALVGALAADKPSDLQRCREEGADGARDLACNKAWREARQKFLRAPR